MNIKMSLAEKKCQACEGGVPPFDPKEVAKGLQSLPGWASNPEHTAIHKTFVFKGFNKTMSFVNMVAYLAHEQQHHPELNVHFDRCVVTFTTHAIQGLSENDFICASKIEKILSVAH